MMVKQRSIYTTRRFLRILEKGWSRVERLVNRMSTAAPVVQSLNPFYHLGTLIIFLLVILTVTGAYLTILYRPGSERAYASVALISANWFGSLMRTSHRYAGDALIIVAFLHAWKMFISDRFWGSRWFTWISRLGAPLPLLVHRYHGLFPRLGSAGPVVDRICDQLSAGCVCLFIYGTGGGGTHLLFLS